jgi:hypothetical protein
LSEHQPLATSLGTSAEVGVVGFFAIEAIDETLADDGLLVQRSGHEVLKRVQIYVSWAHNTPFGSRQTLLSSVRSRSRVSFANGGLHLSIGERISPCNYPTATNILQSTIPLQGKPGFDRDCVLLTGMGVGVSDVAIVNVLNLERSVIEVEVTSNTG